MERWQYLCQFSSLAAVFLSINVALLALLGFSFLFVEEGTGSYLVALLSTGILLVSSTFFLGLIVACRRSRSDLFEEPSFEWDEYGESGTERNGEE